MTQWVYAFGPSLSEGDASQRNLLGGKGANLAEMAKLGLPVPPGFTLSTEVCTYFYGHGKSYPPELEAQVDAALTRLEGDMGARFGDPENPLLVSVRSGARASMPGMMDTVLNLGLSDVTADGLAKRSGDARFAYDSYRRFITMYSDVVLGVDHYLFEEQLENYKLEKGYYLDTELEADDWKHLVDVYKQIVRDELDEDFPQDPKAQLWGAIGAVFGSWMNMRADVYRKLHNIPASWGTAVNIQAMVFGNMGDDCATGVAFTRDPSTGENVFYGEYLVNAQGEDVVAGIRTPQQISIAGKEQQESDQPAMEEVMPEVYSQLDAIRSKLERHYADMQDIEFTVQGGKLFMLQTRNGKRTAQAALKIAVEMVDEGLISPEQAVMRVNPASLDQLLHPTLDPKAERNVLTKGLPASPGAASGILCFSSDAAVDLHARGEKIILARIETSPEDIQGMHAAEGILTARGGMTSHAAVVARGMGRPCVSGAGDIEILGDTMRIGRIEVKAGERLTLDGSTGEVMLGDVPTIRPNLSGDFAKLMTWADQQRSMAVRTNAETPADCETAVEFGAEGIGLCRTEHMFFDADRIGVVRQMILADSVAERQTALDKLLPMQRSDFAAIFTIMGARPVTIRLLDPPLHEFLPHQQSELEEVAQLSGTPVEILASRAKKLTEANPMLGHRGCRLGITFPEIYAMQARAIFEAAAAVQSKSGQAVKPEIMIPLVSMAGELEQLKRLVDDTAAAVGKESGVEVAYSVGTMIELPRAALQAGKIAEHADFFSFGTNDLTQTTYGLSRDDAGNFLGHYEKQGLIERDPFLSLDPDGVGELVQIASDRGRATRADIKLGICGEHGGDPASIEFCQGVGLDYVSCSPFRVPIARLAAAQAALKAKG